MLETTGEQATIRRRVPGARNEEGHREYTWTDIRTVPCYWEEAQGGEQVTLTSDKVVMIDYNVYLDITEADVTEADQLVIAGKTLNVQRATPLFGEYVSIKAKMIR